MRLMKSKVMWLMCIAVMLTACSQPIEKTARDAIAGAKGYIVSARTLHPECSPSQHPENQSQVNCQILAKGQAAEDLTINALEAYCAGPDFAAGGKCDAPAKGTEAYDQLGQKLAAALTTLNSSMADVKALAGGK